MGKKVLDYLWSQYEDYRIEVIGEKATSSIVLAYTSNQWMATVDILGSKGALFLDLQSQSIVKYNRISVSPLRIGLSSSAEAANNFGRPAPTAGVMRRAVYAAHMSF